MHGDPHSLLPPGCGWSGDNVRTEVGVSGRDKVRIGDLGVQWERLGGDLWQVVVGVPGDRAIPARGDEPHCVTPAPSWGFSHHR